MRNSRSAIWEQCSIWYLLREMSQLLSQSKGSLTFLPQGITAELLTEALLETGITYQKQDFMYMTWLL